MIKFLLVILLSAFGAALGFSKELDVLASARHAHNIDFKGIPQTVYAVKDRILNFKVQKSSSALVLAFAGSCEVTSLKIKYQGDGLPHVKSSDHEQSRKGDDSFFRVGLLLAGKAPIMPFFRPAWIKLLEHVLVAPTNAMVYLWPEAKHQRGEMWASPHSSAISNIAMDPALTDHKDAWKVREHTFKEKKMAVGMWLMADGDDTRSEFTGQVSQLSLSTLGECTIKPNKAEGT